MNDGRDGLFLTPEDLARMEEQMLEWEKDPGAMMQWAQKSAKLTLLVLEQIIRKASGRRAAQDVSVAADRLQRMLATMGQLGMLTPGIESKLPGLIFEPGDPLEDSWKEEKEE